jgi:hypothetical protein
MRLPCHAMPCHAPPSSINPFAHLPICPFGKLLHRVHAQSDDRQSTSVTAISAGEPSISTFGAQASATQPVQAD